MSLTSALAFDVKPSAVASRSVRASVNPSNGSTFSGDQQQIIRIDIPTGVSGQYLDCSQSYLKFAVTPAMGTATKIIVDKSAYSFFSKLEVYHNGVLLESIDQHACLASTLFDLQVPNSAKLSDLNVLMGCYYETTSAVKKNFILPLLSGVIGHLQEKYIPLGNLTGDLRLELTLNKNAFVGNGSGDTDAAKSSWSYTMDDIEFMMDLVELDASTASQLTSVNMRNGGINIPAVSWRNFNSTIATGSSAGSILVPAKFTSLKGLLVVQRVQDDTVDKKKYANSTRVGGADFKSMQWRVGTQFVPTKPVACLEEMYAETSKSLHNLSINNIYGGMTLSDYTSSGFCAGIELESFSNRSDVINAGINTTSQLIFVEPTYASPTSSTRRVDTFAMYDMLLTIDATGQARVAF